MTLQSHMLEAAKTLDAWAGIPLARRMAGARRPLTKTVTDAVLIRLWGLGNLAMLAPALTANRDVRLRLITLESNVSFVRHHFPWVELMPLPRPHKLGFLPAAARVAAAMRRSPPDVVIDLEQFLRLPLVLARAACAAPIVGVDTDRQGRGPLIDHVVDDPPTRHVAETFRQICRQAGLRTAPGPGGLRVLSADMERIGRWLPAGRGPLVVIHPGTGEHATARRWPASRFGAAAAILQRRHQARIVITGVKHERPLADAVLAHTAPDVADLTGCLDAGLLAACLSAADLVITNDTGPLHMADALGTTAVAIFGPAAPLRSGPRRRGSVALYADLPCSPCLEDRSMRRTSCRHVTCLTTIAASDVATAAEHALASLKHGRTRALVCDAIDD